MIDNMLARFGSLIDHTGFEVSRKYFAKCLCTLMGLKYIEFELNASLFLNTNLKYLVRKLEKQIIFIQQNFNILVNSVLIMNIFKRFNYF